MSPVVFFFSLDFIEIENGVDNNSLHVGVDQRHSRYSFI